jgi:hypothetical protein
VSVGGTQQKQLFIEIYFFLTGERLFYVFMVDKLFNVLLQLFIEIYFFLTENLQFSTW